MSHCSSPITVTGPNIERFREKLDHSITGTNSSWNLPMFDDDATVEVSGLDTCPHLESGTCWWFSPRESEFEERPDDPGRSSFRQVIRVKRHTGKTNSGSDDAEMEG